MLLPCLALTPDGLLEVYQNYLTSIEFQKPACFSISLFYNITKDIWFLLFPNEESSSVCSDLTSTAKSVASISCSRDSSQLSFLLYWCKMLMQNLVRWCGIWAM